MLNTIESETKNYPKQAHDDEIVLMDLLLVIWRWKYLIIFGTFFCAVIAGIISFTMPKIYAIDMVIRPGILKVDEKGTITYIDSPTNIEALINARVFNEKIIQEINNKYKEYGLKTLSFRTSILRNSDTLQISYETPNKEQGLKILESLSNFLLKEYSARVSYYKNEYMAIINKKNSDIENNHAKIQSVKSQVSNLQTRIDELKLEINHINDNTKTLIQERGKFLSDQDASKGILAAMLYTNTIQQNISLSNTYKKDLNEYIIDKEKLVLSLNEMDNNLKTLKAEFDSLEYKKNSIQNIQQLQSPISSPDPIKPKKTTIILLAAVSGCLIFTFLSFLFEYISHFSHVPKRVTN